MTPAQRIWTEARDRMRGTLAGLGFPEELADLLAVQLGSPKAIDRMTAYLQYARPQKEETIVDEMLAIRAEIDSWREKKESLEAEAVYNDWLGCELRLQNLEEE